jgi:hypothetical protein
MKVFILKQSDFDVLTAAIDRDPKHGYNGGSGVVLTQDQIEAFKSAHKFYNYQIRKWINSVQDERS